VLLERYTKDILIEAHTLMSMIQTQIIPSAYEYRKLLADSANAVKSCAPSESLPELKDIAEVGHHINNLKTFVGDLEAAVAAVEALHDDEKEAEKCSSLVKPIMAKIAAEANSLESKIADKLWPIPKLSEILL
jgi:glutamine synthetase